jgi:autotransporter-associated beta strand protein
MKRSSFALIVGLLPAIIQMFSAQTTRAGSATWLASPPTANWNHAANWTPATIPNGPSDTATFASSNTTGVAISASTQVNSMVFNADASDFTITLGPTFTLTISGVGPTNNSAFNQNFVTATDGAGNFGTIVFSNSAAANLAATGPTITFTNNGATASGAAGGNIIFRDTSTANRGFFINNGGTASNAGGGHTSFTANSSAGNATLVADGGTNGGLGGSIAFSGSSSGGTAGMAVFGNGYLDISGHNAPGIAMGNLEGSGAVFLGGNKLTVGNNNLGGVVSGVIQDGGTNGGTGGSLTKTGKATMTLSNANTYTGGTTLAKGALMTTNKTGSATGTGSVQVNIGTFGGIGKIAGAVMVGNGSSSGAILLPAKSKSATKPGTLTINSALTFNSLSTYKCVLNRSTPIAGKLTALGVTINSNVPFTFVDIGTGTLTSGAVFTVINNTSANPISGTFSNLADGSTFTSGSNTFKANYEGGTGNDLTLTVQ